MTPWCDWHFWIEVAKIFVGAALAAGAAALTWRQYVVSKEKFRLDLFEKREPIYVIVWTAITACLNEWENRAEPLARLNNAAPGAAFLFGKTIGSYVTNLVLRLRDLEADRRRLEEPQLSQDGRDLVTARIIQAEDRLRDDMTNLQTRFSPYLAFEQWGSSGHQPQV